MEHLGTRTDEQQRELVLGKLKESVPEDVLKAYRDPKFACYLEIDYGDLEIGHLVGRIPMFARNPKLSLEHLPEAEEILKKIAMEANMLIPTERLLGENNIIRSSLLCAMYSAPTGDDPRSQYVIMLAAIVLAFYYLDDELCGDFLFTTLNEVEDMVDLWSGIMVKILQGKYEKLEDIPPVPATVEAVVRLWWLITRKIGHFFPPNASTKYIQKAFKKSFHAMTLMRVEAVGHQCSSELYRRLRSADSAATLAIELILIFLKYDVDERVRKHTVYKQIVDMCGEEAGLTNDLVSFVKEMRSNDVYYNFILRNVEVEGMSFEESFDKTIEIITKLRKDIMLLFEQLLEEFPEDDSLINLMIFGKKLMDSNAYVATQTPRYDGMKLTEIPIDDSI